MAGDMEQYEQLTAYLDDELSDDERAAVERLLASDTDARALLEDLRRVSRAVGALPRGRAPDELAQRATARLERQALLGGAGDGMTAPAGRWRWFRPLGVAAALALVCTAGWMMWPRFVADRNTDRVIVMADGELESASGGRVMPVPRAEKQSSDVGSAVRTGLLRIEKQSAAGKGGPLPLPVNEESAVAVSHPDADDRLGEAARTETVSPRAEAMDAKAMTPDVVAALASGPVERLDISTRSPAADAAEPAGTKPQETRLAFAGSGASASPASFQNVAHRLAVETDAVTRDKLVARIESMVDADQYRKLSAPARTHLAALGYMGAGVEEADELPLGGRPTVGDVQFLLRVPQDRAAEIVTAMDQVARANDAKVAWLANDLPVPNAAVARWIVSRFPDEAQALPVRSQPPPPPAEAFWKTTQARPNGDTRVSVSGVEGAQSDAEFVKPRSLGDEIAVAKKGDTDRPAVGPRLVTLSLSLRVLPDERRTAPRLGTVGKEENAQSPVTTQADKTEPSSVNRGSSRPTTQRSAGSTGQGADDG